MIDCPESDRLATLEQAAHWGLSGLLDHVSTCATCRAVMGDLETLHAELAAEAAPRPGFTDEVLRSVTVLDSVAAPRRRYPSPVDLVNIGLAGLTATFAVAVAAGGGAAGTSATTVLAGGLLAAAFYALADVFADSR